MKWIKLENAISKIIVMDDLLEYHLCNMCFTKSLFFHTERQFLVVGILGSEAHDLKITSSSSSHTHLPSAPRTRVGGRRPRVETGDRLSRIGWGKGHALIGGELIRSLAIVSRGRNRQLQKQGRVHSRWTASTEGQEAHQQPEKYREGRRKEGKELILQKKRGRRKEKVMWQDRGNNEKESRVKERVKE